MIIRYKIIKVLKIEDSLYYIFFQTFFFQETVDDKVGTEMTSIAIISQHPFRNSGHAPTISTVPGGPAASATELEECYSMCGDTTASDQEKDSGGWTNFHFVMCVGIVGFFVFWIVLLCRMYLPPEYQFWGPGSQSKL